MRLYLIPSLIAYTLTGCKDTPTANTGDVAVDFVIDSSNTNSLTEEQQKKYAPLAGADCTTKMSAAVEKVMKDESLKKLLSPEVQTAYEQMRKLEPEARKVAISTMSDLSCKYLAGLKK